MTDFLPRLLLLAAICAALVGGGALTMHRHDRIAYDLLKSDFDVFKGGVEALGKAAEKRAREIDAKNAKRKEDADKENAAAVARLNRTIAGLRDERAKRDTAGGFVPQAGGSALGLKLACYDAAKLDDALRILDREVQGLIAEGDAAITDLNTARNWAKRR